MRTADEELLRITKRCKSQKAYEDEEDEELIDICNVLVPSCTCGLFCTVLIHFIVQTYRMKRTKEYQKE